VVQYVRKKKKEEKEKSEQLGSQADSLISLGFELYKRSASQTHTRWCALSPSRTRSNQSHSNCFSWL